MLLKKTKLGQAAFNQRSALFTSRQRAAFIVFDGLATVADTLGKMAPLGVTQQDVDEMCERGLLEPVPEHSTLATRQRLSSASKFPEPSGWTDADRYLLAKPLATQLTARLGLKGFRMNLAVEAATDCSDLALLLPRIQAAAGVEACRELERVLKG